MRKLHVTRSNNLVEISQNMTCFMCKDYPKEVISAPGYSSYGICLDCAEQLPILLKENGLIQGQV